MSNSSKDYLNELYDSQLASTKEQLTQSYNESAAQLDASREAAEKQKQKNLVATNVEAQRNQKNYAELQHAYGLTSGAMAQARLAQDNQLQDDMTDIRTAHQAADAEIERQRSLLAQQFSSAIREAQANNDLARAQALYELAREQEANLWSQQLYYPSASDSGTEATGSGTPEGNSTPQNGDAPSASNPTPSNNQPANDDYVVDMNSAYSMGYGRISADELDRLIAAGEVEEYTVGNMIKFRRKHTNARSAPGDESADFHEQFAKR